MVALWIDKYFPRNFNEFVGNSDVLNRVRGWASDWALGKRQRPLFFFGPTGVGKTCLAILAARQFSWQLFELNASDFRSREVIERIVGVACQGASFGGEKRLILLDEIDGLQAQDRGGYAAIVRILRESKNPVILTANDPYADQRLSSIREQCVLLQFKRINYSSIAARLREILESEGIPFEAEAVEALARNSNGDFRAALLDTQTISVHGGVLMRDLESLGYRERTDSVFKVVDAIFKGKTVEEVRKARLQSEVSDELLFRWVEENIPVAYAHPGDTASAFDRLSRADVFEGRVTNKQHYGFKRYSSELFSCGVALSKLHECHGWLKLRFPQLLKKLSGSHSKRHLKKELAKKIGERIHSSSNEVMAHDLEFVKILFQNKGTALRLSAAFDLNEKEIAFLLNARPESKKVQGLFAQAQGLRQRVVLKRKPLEAVNEETLRACEEKPTTGNEGNAIGGQSTLF